MPTVADTSQWPNPVPVQALWQAVSERGPAGLALFDGGTFRLKWANPQLLEMLGAAEPGQVTGRALDELLPTADQEDDPLRLAFHQVAATWQPCEEAEYRVEIAGRGGAWWRWSLAAVQTADAPADLLLCAVEIARGNGDAAEKILSEAALREWKARYEAAVRAGRQILYDWDLKSGHVTWGGEVETILGYKIEEMGDAGWAFGQMHPDDRPAVESAVAKFVESRDRGVLQYRVRRKDGEYIHVEDCTDFLTTGSGTVARLIGFVTDVTDRKRVERELIALNETLEHRIAERTGEAEVRADQLRQLASELTYAEQRERRRLARVLHDHIQQLLVAAKMNVGILREDARDESLHPPIEKIDRLLDESIDASRSLAVELSPPVLHDRGLGAALHWVARWMNEKYGLVIDVKTDDRAEPADEETRVLLFDAIRELLFNVVKHSGVGEARVEMLPLPDDRVQIVVADAGSGFDAANVGGSSNGFGLSSIRQRVDLLGGTVELESAPGDGTTVTLRAPIRRSPVGGEEPSAGTGPATSDHKGSPPLVPEEVPYSRRTMTRVLLVDDHKIVREGLSGLLSRQADIEIVGEASDGQMAIERARELQPDVIVMDVSMPVMNGVEAARRVTDELPGIRIIGLSLHDQDDMAHAMFDAGAVAYLTKGGPSDDLIAAIRAACPAAS